MDRVDFIRYSTTGQRVTAEFAELDMFRDTEVALCWRLSQCNAPAPVTADYSGEKYYSIKKRWPLGNWVPLYDGVATGPNWSEALTTRPTTEASIGILKMRTDWVDVDCGDKTRSFSLCSHQPQLYASPVCTK